MTLKKMSLKVLSVFMALIMVVGFCAPAVLAAEHEHEKKVEFTYTQEKLKSFVILLEGTKNTIVPFHSLNCDLKSCKSFIKWRVGSLFGSIKQSTRSLFATKSWIVAFLCHGTSIDSDTLPYISFRGTNALSSID